MNNLIRITVLFCVAVLLYGCAKKTVFITKYEHKESNQIFSPWEPVEDSLRKTKLYKNFTAKGVTFALPVSGAANHVEKTGDSKFLFWLLPISYNDGDSVELLNAEFQGADQKIQVKIKNKKLIANHLLSLRLNENLYSTETFRKNSLITLAHEELHSLTQRNDAVFRAKVRVGGEEFDLEFKIDRVEHFDIDWPT